MWLNTDVKSEIGDAMFQFLEKQVTVPMVRSYPCDLEVLQSFTFLKKELFSYFLLLLVTSKPTICVIVLRTNTLNWLIEIRLLRELVSNCGTAMQPL